MGVPLVEGGDLVIADDRVFMKTTAGLAPVHVIYRRINDDFIDPEVFRPDSLLGVPGLMRAYRKGNVSLANAIGTGVADDKAVYAYLPRLIRYYLDQDAILPNVETHICGEADGLSYTLDHLDDLVVKPVGESGGYGIVVGPRASAAERAEMRARVRADPANYISQPMVRLSVCPTLMDDGVRPRHVDLRPVCRHRPQHLGAAGRSLSRRPPPGLPDRQTLRREAGRKTRGCLSSLLARYAECIFWMARYVERAENLARILDVHPWRRPPPQQRGGLGGDPRDQQRPRAVRQDRPPLRR